eukprot:58957_1
MSTIRVAAVQIAPVFLDAAKTWSKLCAKILEASENNATFITFGETLIPGYPSWISNTNGAIFNNSDQKKAFSKYWQEAINISNSNIVNEMKQISFENKLIIMGGIVEKDNCSSSLYCTLLTVSNGIILNRHRKLKPTFEERLIWSDGDYKGLKTYPIFSNNLDFRFGGLNCWENWIPNARATLHDQGEILHVAVWPGSINLTKDITRFMALEGRSFVISVCGLLRPFDFEHLNKDEFPMRDMMTECDTILQNGGSQIVNPKGDIIAGPLIDKEGIIYSDIDCLMAIQERYNFDYTGHYARYDCFNKPLKADIEKELLQQTTDVFNITKAIPKQELTN